VIDLSNTSILVGGSTPLKNMKVSWDYLGEGNKKRPPIAGPQVPLQLDGLMLAN